MSRLEQIRKLRGKGRNKKSFTEIGNLLGISRQRVHSIHSGYEKRYRKTEKYKMYRRHTLKHFNATKLRKPCTYCAKDKAKLSIGSTVLSY